MTNNKRVIKLIKDRLSEGAKQYGQQIPLEGEEGRDNLKEALDEALDLAVYLSATILQLTDMKTKRILLSSAEKRVIEDGLERLIDMDPDDNLTSPEYKKVVKNLHSQIYEARMNTLEKGEKW